MQTFYSHAEWNASRRKLIVHYHIFKNAGTSVDEYLASQFGRRWIAFEGPQGHEPISAKELGAHLVDNAAIEAVSSHKLRPSPLTGFEIFPIILIRDPLDRAYSCYSHSRRSTDRDESCDVARSTDFPGYVEWCLENPNRGGVVIINYQTIHLSRASLRGPIYDAVANPNDLKDAIKLIDTLPVPGTVDLFDEFLLQLDTAISVWSGGLLAEFLPIRANASPERAVEPLENKKSSLRAILGPRLLARFEDKNSLDQALWAYTHGRSLLNALKLIGRPSRSARNMLQNTASLNLSNI